MCQVGVLFLYVMPLPLIKYKIKFIIISSMWFCFLFNCKTNHQELSNLYNLLKQPFNLPIQPPLLLLPSSSSVASPPPPVWYQKRAVDSILPTYTYVYVEDCCVCGKITTEIIFNVHIHMYICIQGNKDIF